VFGFSPLPGSDDEGAQYLGLQAHSGLGCVRVVAAWARCRTKGQGIDANLQLRYVL
jgi:hypothetical protein